MYILPVGDPYPIFILPPKTGTRSLQRALKGTFKAYPSLGRHAINKKQFVEGQRRIATIRHPQDVGVSWYHYSKDGKTSGRTFKEFMLECAHETKYLKASILYGAKYGTEFMRYELGLEQEFNRVLVSLGLKTVKLDHIGAAQGRKPFPDYYDEELCNWFYHRHKVDFEMFGYEPTFN